VFLHWKFAGLYPISINKEDKKLTVIVVGDIDPTLEVSKLRELCRSYYWLKQQKSLLKWLTIIKPND
jgi:ribosomal protein L7Ae-like RNA K-turn-binding protein